MKYSNPIISGFHPDPTICRAGRDYYIANSSFEFLPGVPVFHSRDLVNWEKITHCITRPEQMEFTDCQHNAGIFAPTLRFHNEKFYMITTNVAHEGAFAPGGSGNFIITADQIEGPWSEPHWVAQGGIDPSLFWEEDGTCYMQSTIMTPDESGNMVNAIFQAVINPDTGELLSDSRIISRGCGGRFPEGPHVYKKDDYYYLLLAEGGTEFGHMVTIARSRDIWGPFEPCPHNPILTASQENDPAFAGMGHADLLEAHDGSWWIVYLGYRMSENYYHHMGRETGMAPMEWINGWPIIHGGTCPQSEITTDRLPLADTTPAVLSQELKCETEDFSRDSLGLEWNFFRTFFTGYSLKDHPGSLTLYGNEKTLSDKATPAFIGRRIDNFEFRFSTTLSFEAEESQEAGIAIAHTPFAHNEFVVTRKNGRRVLLLRKRLFDLVTETWSEEVPEGKIELQVEGDRYNFVFRYRQESENKWQKLGEATVKLISSEVAGGCIGTYIGMYASGNGSKSELPAVYHSCTYEWLPEKPKKPMFFED